MNAEHTNLRSTNIWGVALKRDMYPDIYTAAAFRFRFNGPTPVEWWRLDGAGHTVPSRTVLIEPNALTGVQSRDVEFAELAWSFFKATWVAN